MDKQKNETIWNQYKTEMETIHVTEEWKRQQKEELFTKKTKHRGGFSAGRRIAFFSVLGLLLAVGGTSAYAAVSGEGFACFTKLFHFKNEEQLYEYGVSDRELICDEDFRITLERGVTDGQNIMLVCHVEALNEAAQSKIHEERYANGFATLGTGYNGSTTFDEDGKGYRMHGYIPYTDASRYWFDHYHMKHIQPDEYAATLQPDTIEIFADGLGKQYHYNLKLSELSEKVPTKQAKVDFSTDENDFVIDNVIVSSIGVSVLGNIKKSVHVEKLSEFTVGIIYADGTEQKVMTCAPISLERFHPEGDFTSVYSWVPDVENFDIFFWVNTNIWYWGSEAGEEGTRPASVCAMSQQEYELDDIIAVRINEKIYELKRNSYLQTGGYLRTTSVL